MTILFIRKAPDDLSMICLWFSVNKILLWSSTKIILCASKDTFGDAKIVPRRPKWAHNGLKGLI